MLLAISLGREKSSLSLLAVFTEKGQEDD
jgi:hypothetical protein